MKIQADDRKFLFRDESAKNIEIVGTEGQYLIDKKGRRYLDFVMGWCVGNLGWNHESVESAVRNFSGPSYLSPTFLYQPWVELATLLAKITPEGLTKSVRATGGTEAVEIALRAANIYTKKSKFISIEGSYHGESIGAMSVGGSYLKQYQPGLLFKSFKIKPPLTEKTAEQVERLLQREDIAALIMEPIICNLTVMIPEHAFMTRVQALCRQYGALLIMDEVATGFGRTGKLFASEHFGLTPDIMCLAKGMSGGYAALGATIMTEAVAKVMESESFSYSTFGWHPLSVAATIAYIQYFIKNRKKIEKNTEKMSRYFKDRLTHMPFKYSAKIRVIGLAIGIEFSEPGYAPNIVERALEKGLILSLHNDKEFTLFPALNIDEGIAKQGLDILESVILGVSSSSST